MDNPTGLLAVIPSCLQIGEEFTLKVKVLGSAHKIPSSGQWNTPKPGLRSPFNLNVERQIQYMDNCMPAWSGRLRLEGGSAFAGPKELVFDGENQGVYKGDKRPVKEQGGLRFTEPGIHFLRLIDPESGLDVFTNPVHVTKEKPAFRIYWGDPHWQTFFSDGIRCPEELYAFARYEGFLDFGAISDHMEAVTERQWEYFQAVTNDCNQAGRFVTLHGQEWTHHVREFGAPGHRNIYYRGDGGPALRCTDPDCNTLPKLWQKLDKLKNIEAIAIPHHPANTVMGVNWELGWNPRYEKAVEIHSVWGNSERHAEDGNPMPIHASNLQGEKRGQHVQDALRRGYRLGFVGGGDIHDGRPGDAMHDESYPPRPNRSRPEGFTAVCVPALTRENVFDAIAGHRTYATTMSRILLKTHPVRKNGKVNLQILAASEDKIKDVVWVRNAEDVEFLQPDHDARIVQQTIQSMELAPEDFMYVRVVTEKGRHAWSSPVWGDEVQDSR